MPKSFADIVTSLKARITDTLPLLDTKIGSIIRDVFIDPEASELAEIHLLANQISKAQSILTAESDDLDYLISNFGGRRLPAQNAVGIVTFVIYEVSTTEIRIPAETTVSTNPSYGSDTISFTTVSDVSIPAGSRVASVNVVASLTGVDGNVAAGLIDSTDFPIVDAVTNLLAMTGGRDKETDEELRIRAPYLLLGINTGTEGAYMNAVLSVPQIAEAKVLEADSSYSRGLGYVDIYIRPYAGEGAYQTSQLAPAGITVIYFENVPLVDVVSVYATESVSTTYIENTDFIVLRDDTYSKDSYLARDRALWITDMPSGGVTFVYTYNPVVKLAQDAIEPKRNITSDVLVRNAGVVDVYVTASIVVNSYYNSTTVSNDVSQAITNYINNKKIGEELLEVDLLCLISSVPGVDNVTVPLTLLSIENDGTSNDIYITDLQYLQLAESNPTINVV